MGKETENDVTIYDQMIVCVEVVFEGGDEPFLTYKAGAISTLKEILSAEHLDAERIRNNAIRANVQNIYCRASTNDHSKKLEFRIGNKDVYDLEAITFKGDVNNGSD